MDRSSWNLWRDCRAASGWHPITHKLLSENPERYTDVVIQALRDLLRLPARLVERHRSFGQCTASLQGYCPVLTVMTLHDTTMTKTKGG